VKRLAIGLCGGLLFLGMLPAAALAVDPTPVPSQLDQHNDSTLDTWSSGSFTLGQVFTAGKTGSLVGVELYLALGTGSEVVTTSINGIDAFSQPNSTVLASTTATVVAAGFGNPSWVYFSFGTPASVTSGTQYSIVFSSTLVSGDGGGTYAGGAAYGNEGNWAPFGPNSQSFNFRTYVAEAAAATAAPSSCATPSPTLNITKGGGAQPAATTDPCTTAPPTSTGGAGSTTQSGPTLALLICFALGGLGIAAAANQRRTSRG
jgi:hypothetical protein